MATCISHSPEETEALGQAWGRAAQKGWVVGLSGDLGAGKTQLVKGLARGLGISQRVHSPSFALLNIYDGGRLALFHLDLYRLETLGQIIGAGLEEYLQTSGVTVIEWAERWFSKPSPASNGQRPKSREDGAHNTKHGTWSAVPTPQLGSEGLPARFRWVQIDVLTETERRISYEDFGA
jgi:tRNA threonylcarbamoyladenosine biosynthesis protein TsaE